MSRFHIVEHPLIAHKMSVLRNKETKSPLFRQTLREVAYLMTFAVTQHLDLVPLRIETPLEVADCYQGNGLTEALLNILPEASVGHLGMARNDQTLQPEKYYTKLPSDISARQVILADPMLATAGSTVAAIDILRDHGVKDIVFMCLLAAPEGVERLREAHPDVPIFTAALDRQLNEKGYILPGLGDAGDRIYGT
ncbi:MAG: uracil phosphoribosyltransferase [Alphaproteobacteria bacterium]|nr:uracil phosphoribosyltransferase [Alphaproteobacteria bacterium]